MTTPHTGVALLQALHGSCDGVTEFRTFKPGDSGPPSGRAFLKSDDVNSLTFFIGSHLREHAYFGVATRRDGSSGTLENCARLPALFVDLDFKHTPEPIARQRLAECPFAPSALVRSGGGLHPYWLLNEPLDLQDQADRARAASLLRRLAHFLDADLQAAEPARVLRVPGTQNFKYDPPRHVVVELLDPARRYHVSEFDDLLPPEPIVVPGAAFVVPEKICDGARNSTLYKIGRMLKAKGLSRKEIRAALPVANTERCAPPLPEWEVETIVENVWTQPDRAAFVQNGHGPAARVETPRDAAPAASADHEQAGQEEPAAPALLGLDLADFLALEFSPARELVTGVLSQEGGGWIAGEEKLLKTFYCLEEALGLAFGWPVAGKFAVPTRVRVLFIEEEDPPRRTHQRLQALLRGHGLDPGQPVVRAELAGWFRIAVWTGVTLDDPEKVEWVRRTLEAFQPAVVYLDVLRKLTTKISTRRST